GTPPPTRAGAVPVGVSVWFQVTELFQTASNLDNETSMLVSVMAGSRARTRMESGLATLPPPKPPRPSEAIPGTAALCAPMVPFSRAMEMASRNDMYRTCRWVSSTVVGGGTSPPGGDMGPPRSPSQIGGRQIPFAF